MSSLMLHSVSHEYSQDGDSLDNTHQTIKISQHDEGGGFFFVIETPRWAFDNIGEFIDLLRKLEQPNET